MNITFATVLSMAISIGSDSDKKDKPEEIVGPFSVIGFLERRTEQIMESRRAIARIASVIRDTMLDISNLLVDRLTAGGQAELERAVGNLQGLTKAADQASVAAPNSGDSSASKGAEVDLTGIKAAVETRRDSSNAIPGQMTGENGLENADGKTRRASAKAKALAALDATMAVEQDQTKAKNSDTGAPSDVQLPVNDGPVSKADRFKLAFATSDVKAHPLPSPSSDLSPLSTRPSARPNAASLKLDHAEAVHRDLTNTGDVSVSEVAATKLPKEGAPKGRQDAPQTISSHRPPSVPAAP